VIALARIVLRLLADLTGLAVLSLRPRRSVRLFNWRDALVVVRPETLIRWHRAGWRLFWRVKSRPGRPPIPLELRRLIRRMASDWGEERIANELRLKLGLPVSPRTVRKYMPKRPPGRPRGDQRWSTFYAITRARSSRVISSWRSRRHSDCSTCSWSSSTAAADWCATL
jgi:hypothetical protein